MVEQVASNAVLFRLLFDDQAYMWATLNSHLQAALTGEQYDEKQLEETMLQWKEITAERISILIGQEEGADTE